MSYQFIVFDFDGTLIDSNIVKKESFFDFCFEPSGRTRMKNLMKIPGFTRHEIWHEYFEYFQIPKHEREERFTAFELRISEATKMVMEIPGASTVLSELKSNGFNLLLSSMTPQDSLIEQVYSRNWDRYFWDIIGAPQKKVDTLARLISQYHLDKSKIVVVGDGIDDARSAEQNKVRFLKVSTLAGAAACEGPYTLQNAAKIILNS